MSSKLLTKRRLKIAGVALVCLLIVGWFGGNLALYYYIKMETVPTLGEFANSTPEKLKLSAMDAEGEILYLMEIKVQFPFYKEDILQVFPETISYWQQYEMISITAYLQRNNQITGVLSLTSYPSDLMARLAEKNKGKTIDEGQNKLSHIEFLRELHYATPNDFSWWNLSHNKKLLTLLTLKPFSYPSFVSTEFSKFSIWKHLTYRDFFGIMLGTKREKDW